ncbi:hypothetical protein EQP59_07145 [Ornithobacterium rhinotracheale]|uniref:Uncharacterized protein n=1 Tax=Ornithobacterium rhinotracheale TaxID=28251 RepID=A0A410JSX6_ORNRH|nr:hypothetical protein [Ornithobacterium rhinotracheale]MRI64531.1 hypothetical protein [Ornithobacterium rhinotracheale]MRJ09164.1 hypothetical protein [Ornithobacterium rhinotracheale]MRJ11505.1 hypothetical protein [Ornithobacterium rhinotracheale]QAR31121.1 hypothetical protein EQP59_07145 [Ornithobacterium rhinotracheale]UOH77250.1 hypothetical protein MT996_08510 [Ornithobacterium rhinotracheale]
MTTFSSKQYAWCDISIALGGRILEGATEVEYTEKKEKDYLYGRGCKPHGVVGGNRTYEGKLSIWQSELEAMTRDAKNKDILSLSFDVVVAYVPHDGGQMVTDILKGVEFTEVKKAMKQGDKNMIVELPILFLNVKRQD